MNTSPPHSLHLQLHPAAPTVNSGCFESNAHFSYWHARSGYFNNGLFQLRMASTLDTKFTL